MILRDSTHLLRKLNVHCASALEAAANLCHARAHSEITLEHWLLKLIEPGTGDISTILRHYEIDIDQVWNALLGSLERLPHDMRGKPALSHTLMDVLQRAWLTASLTDQQTIRSSHILAALVETPHCLRATDAWPLLSMTSTQIQRLANVLDAQSVESPAEDNEANTAHAASTPTTTDSSIIPNHQSITSKTTTSSSPAGGEALTRFAIDLTAKAQRGEIDPVFGRDREIQQMVDVLARRRKNNPILVGEPGVGKTALAEGLALRVAEGTVPTVIRDVRILTLDLGLLQAGAGVKGEFEQRLKNVIDEVQQSPVPILLFIDEAHTLIGAGNTAGGADAANLLKPALARGELRTIAATTWSEYKEYFERDAALERRFQIIKVDEPDDENAILMLRGLADKYASYHQVHIRDEALVAAVKLSRRYLTGRQLPDKAVDLIDTAAARVKMGLESPPAELERAAAKVAALKLELSKLCADQEAGLTGLQERSDTLQIETIAAQAATESIQQRYQQELILIQAVQHCREQFKVASAFAVDNDEGNAKKDAAFEALSDAQLALRAAQGKTPLIFVDVNAQAVARVVAEWTGVPVGNLVEDELLGLLSLEHTMASRVVAQEAALAALASSLRTAKAGLKNEHSPLGVFLLAGSSGVGKTETALALADVLFGGEAALTTINMSEYQESHTVSQLKGSPPGYVGYGRGGVLTEAVRQRPYSVILLDEVEKAHRDVLEMFYQVFDRGSMRDGEGREINFCNCVILMTSNLGSAEIMEMTLENPAISQSELMEAVHPLLSAHFQPALLARFQPILYRPLQADALSTILRIKLDAISTRLQRQYGIQLSYDDTLLAALAQACLLRESGARNIDSLLNQQILPVVAQEILARLATGDMPNEVHLSQSKDGNLVVEFLPIEQSRTAAAAVSPAPVTDNIS